MPIRRSRGQSKRWKNAYRQISNLYYETSFQPNVLLGNVGDMDKAEERSGNQNFGEWQKASIEVHLPKVTQSRIEEVEWVWEIVVLRFQNVIDIAKRLI